jgi:hypothetical protein
LPELVLRRGKRSDLGVEGGLQLVGLLGLLLSCARPLLCLALLGLRLLEPCAELPIVSPDGAHLCLPVGHHRAHLLQIPPHLLQRLIPIDEGCANPLEGGGRAAACPSYSKGWSRRASARYDSQPSGVPKAFASTSKASRCSRSWRSSALIRSKAPYLSRA